MKKTLAVLAFALFASTASAQGVIGATPRVRSSLVYDSGIVAAGGAIDSGVLDISAYSVCSVFVDNSAGAAVRLASWPGYMSDGTTQIVGVAGIGGAGNTAIGGYGIYTIGVGGGTAGVTAGAQFVLPPKMKFLVAAAGAANGRLVVYCR